MIHHGLLGNAPGRHLAIGPAHDQRHANTTLIELTLAAAQRRIRGHVCLAAIVAAENKNCVPINPQFTQLAVNHSDTIINTLQHRRQMWIVMTRPMITRITLHTGILTKIAPFSIAHTRPRRVLTQVFLHEIWFTIQDRVRRIMTEVEKKRPLMIAFNELHRLMIQSVGQILAFAQFILR